MGTGIRRVHPALILLHSPLTIRSRCSLQTSRQILGNERGCSEMNNVACWALALFLVTVVAGQTPPTGAGQPARIDLAKLLKDGNLRTVNRETSSLVDRTGGVHMSEKPGAGVAWIEGVNFGDGQIQVEVRGRDKYQQSFVGIAFHGKDDNTYEAVYLRPFNFRAEDPVRHRHALQYMMVPEFDWPKLRDQFPNEFERPVPPSLVPTGWVTLRVAVHEDRVEVMVNGNKEPVLSARKLGNIKQGKIGLWTGNGSGGDFADLQILRAR